MLSTGYLFSHHDLFVDKTKRIPFCFLHRPAPWLWTVSKLLVQEEWIIYFFLCTDMCLCECIVCMCSKLLLASSMLDNKLCTQKQRSEISWWFPPRAFQNLLVETSYWVHNYNTDFSLQNYFPWYFKKVLIRNV